MKILVISLPSIHVVRWIENLAQSDHGIFWFDIRNRGKLKTSQDIKQYTNWHKRKVKHIRGEYFLQKKYPDFYARIEDWFQVSANEKLQQIIKEVEPDLIHSFCMQISCYPIIDTMRSVQIPWAYSSWGSDLYYFKNFKSHQIKIKKIMSRINFLITDCERDHHLANEFGFKGKFIGEIPGGGGYLIERIKPSVLLQSKRNLILVKGYEHRYGRGLNIIKALMSIDKSILKNYEIIIFGANPPIAEYLKIKNIDWKVFYKEDLTQLEVLKLMGKAKIYIGNSISDGIPNTLIEALIMGVFPIQSDPGGASAELINDGKNGFLIEDPANVLLIKSKIIKALNSPQLLEESQKYNTLHFQEKFNFVKIQRKILNFYKKVQEE